MLAIGKEYYKQGEGKPRVYLKHTMTKPEKGIEIFNNNFNCSQAVIGTFADELGLSEETAFKISSGFGGGMRQSEVCGAVSGSIMAIGLKHGQKNCNDNEGKNKTNTLVKEFNKEFNKLHSSCICKKLLGCDKNTPEGKKILEQNKRDSILCPKLISSAIELTEEFLKR